MVVVLEHRDVRDVSGSDDDRVIGGDRRLVFRQRWHGHDGHSRRRRRGAIRDHVGELELPLDRRRGRDPDDRAVEDLDGQRRRLVGDGDGLHGEHLPTRRLVVGEHRDRDRLVRAEVALVLHRDGWPHIGRLLEDVHADEPDARRDAGAERVLEVVGARLVGGDGDRLLLEARRRHEPTLQGVDADEAERRTARGLVVREREDLGGLSDERRHEVRGTDRAQGTGRLHVDLERALRRGHTVGHHELDVARAHLGRGMGERDEAVRREPHEVAGCGRRRLEEDVVAVGVAPVGEHVVGDRLPGLDRDRGLSMGRRGLVDLRGLDREAHDRFSDSARATVVDGIAERGRACDEALRRGELEGPTTVDGFELAGLGGDIARVLDGEDVTVGVGVVVEERQDRRAARTDPEGVVAGDRRTVLLGALGEGVLEGLLGGLLVAVLAVLLLRRRHLVPVVDETHVRLHEPGVAGLDVVEGDHRAVDAEDELLPDGLRVDVLDDRLLVGALGGVPAGRCPGAVHAAVEVDGCGDLVRARRRGEDVRVEHLWVASTERDADQGVTGRDDGAVVRRRRFLDLERITRKLDDGTVLLDEVAGLEIEDDRLLTGGAQLVVLELRELRLGLRAVGQDPVEASLGGRHREDGALRGDDRLSRLADGDDRLRLGGVEAELAGGVDRPELARLPRDDRQTVTAVVHRRTGGQRDPLNEAGEGRVDALE